MIKEKRRRQARRKRLLAVIFVFLCLIAVLALIGIKGFTIRDVEVDGNELYTDQQIKDSILNDKYAWNGLYVTLKHRLFGMEEVPFIDDMEVELVSMHKIRIKVYEKAIIGYIETNEQNVYFDREGFVVEISQRLMEGIPKVEGIACNEVVVYEKLNLKHKSALSVILTFSQQLQKYGLVPQTVVYSEKETISADFGEITVEAGDAQYLVEKVIRLNSIMPKIAGKKGVLHLENWTPLTKDVFFAPAGQAKKGDG